MTLRSVLSAGVVLGAVLLAGPGSTASREPACRASLLVEPDTAYVEQAVRWQLRVETAPEVVRIEWLDAPAFPGTRSERVTIRPESRLDGGWTLRREERILFPEQPGALTLPAARLACHTGTGEASWHELTVARRGIAVLPLPTEGRPHGFSGLVGPVKLRRYLRPERIALGGTARITVSLRGSGNVWSANDPHRELTLEGADLFDLSGETTIERGGGLRVGRVFQADLVPRRTGELTLPALGVSWFDPDSRRYRIETADALRLIVGERPVGPMPTREPVPPPGRAPAASAVRGLFPAAGLWIALRAILLLALVVGIAWQLRRRLAGRIRPVPGAGGSEDEALARAERALREALLESVPELRSRAASELADREDLSEAVRSGLRLLVRVERARFDRNVVGPTGDEIAGILHDLRTHST